MKGLGEFLGSAPFVLLGALGIVSIVGTFTTLEENIALTLEAWRTITRPVWDFLLGWVFDLAGWRLPWWLKDYLTIGAVTCGMTLRRLKTVARGWGKVFSQSKLAHVKPEKFLRWKYLLLIVFVSLLLWPVEYLQAIIRRGTRHAFFQSGTLPTWGDVGLDEAGLSQARELEQKARRAYWSTAVWALVLLGLNFALVQWLGLEARPPEIEIWV